MKLAQAHNTPRNDGLLQNVPTSTLSSNDSNQYVMRSSFIEISLRKIDWNEATRSFLLAIRLEDLFADCRNIEGFILR